MGVTEAKTGNGQWKVRSKVYWNSFTFYHECGIELKSYQWRRGKWRKTKVDNLGLAVVTLHGPVKDFGGHKWSSDIQTITYYASPDRDSPRDDEYEFAFRRAGLIILDTAAGFELRVDGITGIGFMEVEGQRVHTPEARDGKVP